MLDKGIPLARPTYKQHTLKIIEKTFIIHAFTATWTVYSAPFSLFFTYNNQR